MKRGIVMDSFNKDNYAEEKDHIWNLYTRNMCACTSLDEKEHLQDIFDKSHAILDQLQKNEQIIAAYKERARLCKVYCEKDQEYEKAKGKRTLFTILGFCIVYYLILYWMGRPTGIALAIIALPAILIGVFNYWIGLTIFGWLGTKGHEEQSHLDRLKEEISSIEKTIAGKPCPANQKIKQLKHDLDEATKRLESFKHT